MHVRGYLCVLSDQSNVLLLVFQTLQSGGNVFVCWLVGCCCLAVCPSVASHVDQKAVVQSVQCSIHWFSVFKTIILYNYIYIIKLCKIFG